MTPVQGPLFDVSQLRSHLTPHLCLTLGFGTLCCCVLPVCDLRGRESCKAFLGPRTSGSPSMELTSPHRESSGALAQGPPTGLGFAPNTLPVWAIEPWFGIGFHCAQLSSIHGVLLYLILEVIARHAWLSPRTAVRAKPSNANWAQATLIIGRRCAVYCPLEPWFLVPSPSAYTRWFSDPGPGLMYQNGECFVIRGSYKLALPASSKLNL